MSFLERFTKKTPKTETVHIESNVPIPEDLYRSQFPAGIMGDLEQARAAANRDKMYFWELAPQGLQDVIKKSDGSYYMVDKLKTLKELAEKEGWTGVEQIDVAQLNAALQASKEAGTIKPIEDEGNPIFS
ncbi:MAG: hypothetical protein Greene041614_554 [Parcubacteria group bacterium Greene0416_14]|nr:MAG: hypothetical protein Greene041614_554 [Parcubacteria group bacterium Greene0416_14]